MYVTVLDFELCTFSYLLFTNIVYRHFHHRTRWILLKNKVIETNRKRTETSSFQPKPINFQHALPSITSGFNIIWWKNLVEDIHMDMDIIIIIVKDICIQWWWVILWWWWWRPPSKPIAPERNITDNTWIISPNTAPYPSTTTQDQYLVIWDQIYITDFHENDRNFYQ